MWTVPLHVSLTLHSIPLAAGLLKCLMAPRGNVLRYSQNYEKRLLDPSCLSVLLSAWNSLAPTRRILIEFDIRILFKNLPRKFKFRYNVARIRRTLHADLCTAHLWQSLWILLRMSFFSPNAITCPFVEFVVLPPGHGRSVTDFWGWDAHEAQLRCPDVVWVVIEWDAVPGEALNLKSTNLPTPWSRR